MKSNIALVGIVSFVLGIAVSSAMIALAWTGPSSPPPGSNVAAPINVGSTEQTKSGSLIIDNILEANDLSIWGSMILGGTGNYLNFGTTAGSAGYGFRDNAGVMEVKSSSGSWAQIATTTGSGSSFNLYNNAHTNVQCEAAGGLVRSIGASGYLCQMTGTACLSGWTRLNNWGVTHPGGGVGTGAAACVSGCITGSHEFSDTAIESCSYQNQSGLTCFPATAQARLEAVGCY